MVEIKGVLWLHQQVIIWVTWVITSILINLRRQNRPIKEPVPTNFAFEIKTDNASNVWSLQTSGITWWLHFAHVETLAGLQHRWLFELVALVWVVLMTLELGDRIDWLSHTLFLICYSQTMLSLFLICFTFKWFLHYAIV